VVSGLTPSSASTLGGTPLYVTGTGLTGVKTFSFGIAAATPVVVSDTAVLVNAPSHAAAATVYPVATKTVYRNPDGTGAETTQYTYTWVPNWAGPQSMTVTRPTVGAAQNGPGTPDTEAHAYDLYGREIWGKDGDGFLTYTEYDQATGAVVKTIKDVDTSRSGDFRDLPAGWATPAGGGLHLVTRHEVDALGRDTAVTDPNGNVTYTVYDDPSHASRTYAGWNAATGRPTGPTRVVREDRWNSPSYVETLTMSAAPSVTNGRPDGTELVSGVQTLSRTFTNADGHVVETDAYFNLNGVAYSTAPYIGTAGTNYYATTYGYDHHGRRDRVQDPTGTITRTVYDGLGRVVSTWVGTNDTPASGWWSPDNNTAPANMVQVTANVYDNGGVGEGDLTQVTRFPGGGAAPRVTQYFYDWRDRLVASKQGVQASEADGTHRPILYTQYDNLDEVVSQERYDGDGVSVTTTNGVPDRPAASLLRARTTTQYDDQGRAFRTDTYSVDPASGAVSASSLTSATWYDHRGDAIKTVAPGGPVAKNRYDGAGRVVSTYQTDGLGDATWADAGTVANNNVLSQTDTQYDADGNALLVVQRQRFHDETTLGALGDANATGQAKARASYAAGYYDAANRLTDSVKVGTNGGTAYTRLPTVPAASDTVLVTHTDYNAAGWVGAVTDPRGLVSQTSYDLLGRVTRMVANFSGDGTPTNSTSQTTAYTYDGADHVLTLTAVLPAGAAQTTRYVYGVSGVINSNDLLASTVYPANGQPNVESYAYEALGERSGKTDRNGTAHAYGYDVLGRQTADAVTAVGAGVDGQVRRIQTAYDGQGNAYLVTSYDAASGGNVVNQVLRQYNGLGQLTAEYQSHGGAVDTASTPAVRYAYSMMAGGANHSRLLSMTYPNGRVLSENYAAGVDDAVSRLTSLSDSSGVLEAYTYLGLDTVVQRVRPQAGEELTYVKLAGEMNGDAGDPYTGLDRFGRVVDQRWLTSGGAPLDEYRYGYDRDGNRLYRENVVNALFSELYHYDGLNRLTDFSRGQLNATHDGLAGPASHSQSWQLDALGNWNAVTTDGSTQTRTANAQNQIASITGASTPGYDANGDTTADETGQGYVYDAWNRLVRVNSGSGTPIESYAYDGLNRRVVENSGTARDLYYSAAWQVIEERVAGAMQAQYVWSPGYADALVARDGGAGTRLYVQQDANWDVTSVASAAGVVQERYAYDPYGKPTFLDAGWNPLGGSTVGWAYLHQGGRLDGLSGLYLFRYRDYSPTLGGWLQQDPAGYVDGLNRYQDVSSNPTDRIDPLGLGGWTQVWGGVKAFGGALQAIGGFGFAALTAETLAGAVGGTVVGMKELEYLWGTKGYKTTADLKGLVPPTPPLIPPYYPAARVGETFTDACSHRRPIDREE
jgi:RHS repeat-associated protein